LRQRTGLSLALAAALLAPPCALAQLGGLRPILPAGALGQVVTNPAGLLARADGVVDPAGLLNLRTERLDQLIHAHPHALEADDHGAPVVRGQVLALSPTAASLAIASKAGFDVARPTQSDAVETGIVVLGAPSGLSARAAVKRLRRLDPAGTYDFNHIYLPAGPAGPVASPAGSQPDTAAEVGVRIGLIDTGVDIGNPLFADARIEQKSFAAGPTRAAPHGTEVASLLIGHGAAFRGAAPGGSLFVADVYGADPAGGAADALARALFWLADRKVQVVNISLVGPPNAVLDAAVKAIAARGILIVAAVGNDGPAAPAAYPASYRDVIAVTGVDARGRVLFEAGHATHLDFAAPGADMAAASMRGGYVAVRGTSFAAPLVAGRLAGLAARSNRAMDALAAQASPGRGYGRGLVAMDLRTPPALVHAAAPIE